MERVIIEKNVGIHPKYLNVNIKKHILDAIRIDISNKCTKEHGYILEIHAIEKIVSQYVERANSEIIFHVTCSADILKPREGMNIEGKVCMIYKDGIFLTIMDKQNMLIPKSNLSEFTYNDLEKIYEHSTKADFKIKSGDFINAVITAVGYKNNKYSCFGTLQV